VRQRHQPNDRVSMPNLFAGPRGTGKTSTAKILAMALNCEAGQGKGDRDTRRHLCALRSHPPRQFSLERDGVGRRFPPKPSMRLPKLCLREKVHFAPLEGSTQGYTSWTKSTCSPTRPSNALLKTLEEPPAHAIFVLATPPSRTSPRHHSLPM